MVINAVVCSMSDMAEPAYEYAHPPLYHPTPKKYPHKEPFDRYDFFTDSHSCSVTVPAFFVPLHFVYFY